MGNFSAILGTMGAPRSKEVSCIAFSPLLCCPSFSPRVVREKKGPGAHRGLLEKRGPRARRGLKGPKGRRVRRATPEPDRQPPRSSSAPDSSTSMVPVAGSTSPTQPTALLMAGCSRVAKWQEPPFKPQASGCIERRTREPLHPHAMWFLMRTPAPRGSGNCVSPVQRQQPRTAIRPAHIMVALGRPFVLPSRCLVMGEAEHCTMNRAPLSPHPHPPRWCRAPAGSLPAVDAAQASCRPAPGVPCGMGDGCE